MNKQFDLLIDTKRTGFNTVRGLKEGDNNSVLNITLVQNSIPFDLTDLTVRINYKRPDNKIFLQMADITNAMEGKIKVNILTKVLEKVGEARADLSIFDKDNRKITSVTFSMFIDASIYRNDYIEPEDLDLIQDIYSKEKERQASESERIKEESRRIKQEINRQELEKRRENEEKERQASEKIRIENENKRIKSEENRKEFEGVRRLNEELRIKQESERNKEDSQRTYREQDRIRAENIRIKNEAEREKTHEEVKEVVTNIGKIEPYNNDKAYKKLNRVTYNGSSYEALKDVPEDVMPTNEEYWICIAEKGKDGKGSGNMNTNTYDKNGDGVVDLAEKANSVEWSNIENAPNLDEIGKVKSVNGKVGEVVLNAKDISTGRNKTVEQELTDTRTVLLNLTNNKLNESTFNDFKQNTESQLENTKGTISSYYPIINVSTHYERQVSASRDSSAEGRWSQVIASDDCHTKHYKDVIIGSRNCIAKGKYSNAGAIILASDGVETTDTSYIVCGGYHRDDSSMKNKKWEINSKEGTIKATGAITGNSSLADFAEYFESIDRKAISTGTIVTLDGDKIRPCKENEEMLGVISETAGVLLNACGFHWQDRYQRNEFGGLIYEKIYDEESKQYITVPRENQEHDMKEEYIAREDREEWNVVGLTGQVYVRIDNIIQVGDFITSNNFGIATKDNNPTYIRWKVMKITTPYNEEKGYGVALVFIR
ncbi:peptidase G2 autoproteolytic cleavage domain-containing protein [Clostridium tetani]|uniref:peptidase G2 autoproteolytic cleavage domain-containing protein n=1 Tax=Clostridium tetani TaxID=1513 RepID=UPI0038B3A5E1